MNFNEFFNELKRRNVFKGTVSYLVFSFVLLQVVSILGPIINTPVWVGKFIFILLVVLLPLWIFVSWYFEITTDGIKRTKNIPKEKSISKQTGKKFNTFIIVFLVLAVVLLFVDRFRITSNKTDDYSVDEKQNNDNEFNIDKSDKSIAVLPFKDMSPNKSQGYFADGLAEELLNSLARVTELKVTSRTSAFSFKNKKRSIPEIAARLQVNYILEGSVRTYDSLIRISVKLIETEDDKNIWSQQWDKELKNIFKIQNEISEAVAENLQLTILDNVIPKVKEAKTNAYAKFLEAKYEYAMAQSDAAFKIAKTKLEQAIAVDSTYAPAWLLLGDIYHAENNYGFISAKEGLEKVTHAAYKAKQIDSTNAGVYTLLSLIALDYERDFKKAGELATKALLLEPNNAEAIVRAAEVAFLQKKLDEALILQNKAIQLDPLNDDNYYLAANTYYAAKNYDKALHVIEEAIKLSPHEDLSHATKATILLRLKRYEEAINAIEREPLEGFKLHIKALIYYYMDENEKSEKILKTLIKKYGKHYGFQIAINYAEMNETEKMYQWLNKAYANNDFGLIELHVEQAFDPYRNDSKFKKFVKKLGYNY